MNISVAALRMPRELGFNARIFGLGAGIFFLGYLLLEIPGALIAERWSARRWIARVMVSWGDVTALTGFIHSSGQFYAVRFLLGLAEAGFSPAVVIYLTHWFIYEDRAKVMAIFLAATPVSYILGSPLAGYILRVHWWNLSGWRWLFILEGIPAIAFGVVSLVVLTDWPHQARWLPEGERSWLTNELQREMLAKRAARSYTIWQAMRDRNVLLLTARSFLVYVSSYGFGFWLPTILRHISGGSDFRVAVLAALPYAVGLITMPLNGWHSDRTLERRWHIATPLLFAGLGFLLVVFLESTPGVALALFTFISACMLASHAPFWALPSELLGESAAAASYGLINAAGAVGGFVGPFFMGYLETRTHSYSSGLYLFAFSLFLGAASVLAVKLRRTIIYPQPKTIG